MGKNLIIITTKICIFLTLYFLSSPDFVKRVDMNAFQICEGPKQNLRWGNTCALAFPIKYILYLNIHGIGDD